MKKEYMLFVAPRCILMTDQSDAGSVGIFSWRTNEMEHNGVVLPCRARAPPPPRCRSSPRASW
eukprot:3287824-Pyramimonas_sp.AAC.1